jgi:uncharacterized repeat protein (TIGR03837 family)
MDFGRIDIFCDVVDNYGDAGVSFRIAKSLKNELPDSKIRIFTNGMMAFGRISGSLISCAEFQNLDGIEYFSYKILTEEFVKEFPPAPFVIETFGCQIPEIYYDRALDSDCLIINLDHLSAEEWIEKVHKKESPTGMKAKKYFFMPGFNERTGGLLIGDRLSKSENRAKKEYFINRYGLDGDGITGTVFTYGHDFENFLNDIIAYGKKTEIIVFGHQSQDSFTSAFPKLGITGFDNRFAAGNLKIVFSKFLPQEEYDELLSVTDFNFVRGEDSWARACLSAKPFVWHAYHQKDNYQQVKVKAFCSCIKKYFPDEDLYLKFSEYMTAFNDRDGEKGDPDIRFFFENAGSIQSCCKSFSEYLFKNCNLIKNLLFFGGSLR